MSKFREYTAATIAAIEVALAIFPAWSWWPYAAARLGTFIMAYIATLATAVLGFTVGGVALGIGGVLVIVPLAVFIAIRVSGAMTEKLNAKKPHSQRPQNTQIS